MNTNYQNRIIIKADNMTPIQLIKKILSLKTRGIERSIYENALINNVGSDTAQEMLKSHER
jgi:hypothetical protein